MEAQALYAISLKHIANDNAPVSNTDAIEFIYAALDKALSR